MAKILEIVLVLGISYTYNKKKFVRGKAEPVDNKTYNYLISLTERGKDRFMDKGGLVAKVKSRVKTPDVDREKEGLKIVIPTFRSKADLAEHAEKVHGFKFEVSVSSLKMEDMRKELTKHIEHQKENTKEEPTVAV